MAVGIPAALDTDVEDVVWALQTAASLWIRDERVDAIVWLRRAAQAAGDAQHDERALTLAREAAELSEWIARNPPAVTSTPSLLPTDHTGVDDPLRASQPDIPIEVGQQVSMSASTEPVAFLPVKPPPLPVSPSTAPRSSVRIEPDSNKVRSAAEAHAGMLDPWASEAGESAPPRAAASSHPQVVSSDDYEDEVVTSARIDVRELPPAEPAVVLRLPPPPLPVITGASAPDPEPLRPAPAVRAPAAFPPERTLISAGTVPEPKVDLSGATALGDLPDDARAALERGAEMHDLSRDEEVAMNAKGTALAYIVMGEVDVAAQIVDSPAERIGQGYVLKARGTVAEGVPLRLVCASDRAVIATWTAEQIEPALTSCPWVEDDLRAAANRVQALVGVTLGPLAERLDASLRAAVTNRLELRALDEGELLVEVGQPVRELWLLGQGSIELVEHGQVVGSVGVGEFVFASEILTGGKARASARVGKGGALVLTSDRAVAQELMSTCPPLVEIFAGT